MTSGSKLLATYLAPLEKYLKRDDIVDICINEPGIVRMQTIHGNPPWIVQTDKELTLARLNNLAEHLANAKGQVFSENHPILATTIPKYGYRVLCASGSIVESGFCLSIRVAKAQKFPLENYFNPEECDLIREAVREGKSFAIVGGTCSGKTTLLNSMIEYIPKEKRIVAIEDSAEIAVDSSNVKECNFVRFLKSKSGTDIGRTTYQDMINASLRINPDVILVGELDIENTMPFLRIINTGHSGAMTTLHADGPKEAIAAMAMNAALCGYDHDAAYRYAAKALDYVVFIKRQFNKFQATIHRMKDAEY